MSIAEINAEFKKYDATFKVVDNGLDHIETGQCENPQEYLQASIAPQVKELFNSLEHIKLAFRDLPEVDKSANRKRFKTYKQSYVTVLNRVKDASNKAQRNELLSSNAQNEDDDSTEEKYIAEGEMILDKNQEILQATLARIHEARIYGEKGIDKLQNQNEQFLKISDDLDAMETSLDVSKRVLIRMTIQLATDKFIWLILFLVCGAIVATFIILHLWVEQ